MYDEELTSHRIIFTGLPKWIDGSMRNKLVELIESEDDNFLDMNKDTSTKLAFATHSNFKTTNVFSGVDATQLGNQKIVLMDLNQVVKQDELINYET